MHEKTLAAGLRPDPGELSAPSGPLAAVGVREGDTLAAVRVLSGEEVDGSALKWRT
jgi:hypothetical protein